MQKLKLVMLGSLLMICVAGCSTTTVPTTSDCLGAHRFRSEIIEQFNRAELEQELNHNDQEVARGCAVPNQQQYKLQPIKP